VKADTGHDREQHLPLGERVYQTVHAVVIDKEKLAASGAAEVGSTTWIVMGLEEGALKAEKFAIWESKIQLGQRTG
jgi:hypothetical protein